MCNVDRGVLGRVWWGPCDPQPFVDFNTKHRCKNYDAIRKWAEEQQLPEDVPEGFYEPPSGKIYDHIP